jgi:CCR4-NOT transcription complex subunit 3
LADIIPEEHTLTEEERNRMLESSYKTIPREVDGERPNHYVPQEPYPTPPYYPSVPLDLFSEPEAMEKMDIDTLFYIFYYQKGTYQQYLASRELKKQAWRFHKRYLTWFQRHEEPKVITDEYESGTYRYFDFEASWVQRKKSDFKFQYEYLEDGTS